MLPFSENDVVIQDVNDILSSDLNWKNLKGKNILITGAAGFLASYMLKVLLSITDKELVPNKIIALVRNVDKFLEKFPKNEKNSRLIIVQGDVSNQVKFDIDIDIIIHAASIASPKLYKERPVETIAANVIGTKNLLDLIKNVNDSKFLYFSSAEIYGNINLGCDQIKENEMGYLDSMDPRACYAESKRMGENLCVSYAKQFNIKTVVVRPFHTYGPGMNLDDGRVFTDFVKNIISKEDISIKSDGLTERAFCYVSDAVKGFFYVLLNGDIATAYNVGNPSQNISIKNLAELLVNEFQENSISVCFESRSKMDSYIPSTVLRCCPDITKIESIGWSPIVSVRNGFRRTVDSFMQTKKIKMK